MAAEPISHTNVNSVIAEGRRNFYIYTVNTLHFSTFAYGGEKCQRTTQRDGDTYGHFCLRIVKIKRDLHLRIVNIKIAITLNALGTR